ncbi:hypothetical protein [Paraburkholderia hayleyella]|uniref:hypothetical protein n=1 Tax=Paraburkholderia hayleyella TaxID=2152889 RepID=UPI0012925CFF|nr:hypothetical protein [Paraburkholderia hayleyella]
MKKLLVAALAGTLSATMLIAMPGAFAQGTTHAPAKATAKKATPKAPAPRKRLIKRKVDPAKAAIVDPVLEGSEKWSCKEGLAFELKGDMKRDQIVTVHWGNKNYHLPRQSTTTGADRFHDLASGMDLVVIPTKAMLFSDKDSARLADECQTLAMRQGAPAPTQSNAIDKNSN